MGGSQVRGPASHIEAAEPGVGGGGAYEGPGRASEAVYFGHASRRWWWNATAKECHGPTRGQAEPRASGRQLTLAMRWCRRGRGGRRRAREARARGRGLGRKRGLWRHIEYVWRAQAAEGAGLPGAATERLSTGAAKAWLCVASATFCYLAPRRRWREAQSTPPASARRRLCRPRRRST